MIRDLKQKKRRPLSQSFHNLSALLGKDDDKAPATNAISRPISRPVLSNITNNQNRQKYKSMIFDEAVKVEPKKNKRFSLNFGATDVIPDESCEDTEHSSSNTSPFTDCMDNSNSSIDDVDSSAIKQTILTSASSSTMSFDLHSPVTPVTPTTPSLQSPSTMASAKRSKRVSRHSLSNIMEFIHQINYDFSADLNPETVTKEIDEIDLFNRADSNYKMKVVSSAVVLDYQVEVDGFNLDDIDYVDILANEDYHEEIVC